MAAWRTVLQWMPHCHAPKATATTSAAPLPLLLQPCLSGEGHSPGLPLQQSLPDPVNSEAMLLPPLLQHPSPCVA